MPAGPHGRATKTVLLEVALRPGCRECTTAAALRDELARCITAGRRTGGRKVRVATGQSTAPTASDRERAAGHEMSNAGTSARAKLRICVSLQV